MKRLTVLSIITLLCACSKTESTTTTNPSILGKWHMAKYIDWQFFNGVVQKDSATLDPLAILAEFKADSTVFVQERFGSFYNKDTQRYRIVGKTLYLTKYWTPIEIDTFQITTFNATTLSLYLKSSSSNGLPQKWNYWVR